MANTPVQSYPGIPLKRLYKRIVGIIGRVHLFLLLCLTAAPKWVIQDDRFRGLWRLLQFQQFPHMVLVQSSIALSRCTIRATHGTERMARLVGCQTGCAHCTVERTTLKGSRTHSIDFVLTKDGDRVHIVQVDFFIFVFLSLLTTFVTFVCSVFLIFSLLSFPTCPTTSTTTSTTSVRLVCVRIKYYTYEQYHTDNPYPAPLHLLKPSTQKNHHSKNTEEQSKVVVETHRPVDISPRLAL